MEREASRYCSRYMMVSDAHPRKWVPVGLDLPHLDAVLIAAHLFIRMKRIDIREGRQVRGSTRR